MNSTFSMVNIDFVSLSVHSHKSVYVGKRRASSIVKAASSYTEGNNQNSTDEKQQIPYTFNIFSSNTYTLGIYGGYVRNNKNKIFTELHHQYTRRNNEGSDAKS